MADADSRGRGDGAGDGPQLTQREQEVAALVAAGLTNAEIAERLGLTAGAVASHVEDILRKLGLRNRVQIAVWAVEHGLYRSDRDIGNGEIG